MSKTKVFLKPTDEALRKVMGLYDAIDTLVHNDCFRECNTMRKETGDPLFWDWSIVEVCGERIPVPYHTADEAQCVLYNYRGEEVYMSHEECVYTNAKFFLIEMVNVLRFVAENADKVNPFVVANLSGGKKFYERIGHEKFVKIIIALEKGIGVPGFRVLD